MGLFGYLWNYLDSEFESGKARVRSWMSRVNNMKH